MLQSLSPLNRWVRAAAPVSNPAAERRIREVRYAIAPHALGRVLVAATPLGICSIALGDDDRALASALKTRFPKARAAKGDETYWEVALDAFQALDRPEVLAEVPLDLIGTPFERRVWAALREIPPGRTASYGEIAAALGELHAIRSVARACAANPTALAVPCHRVVRSDGSLAGYRWGIARKAFLLAQEEAR
jgi:AraC family transcriptional regulator of adaptative response/methylated-DNA-[protein]-cysteine methyltransferase